MNCSPFDLVRYVPAVVEKGTVLIQLIIYIIDPSSSPISLLFVPAVSLQSPSANRLRLPLSPDLSASLPGERQCRDERVIGQLSRSEAMEKTGRKEGEERRPDRSLMSGLSPIPIVSRRLHLSLSLSLCNDKSRRPSYVEFCAPCDL